MQTYHLRRTEKALTDPAELLDVIRGQKHMTLALCQDNQPYLVTMNYIFDAEQRCFYFHCALQGKKMDYWSANPLVWGQVLEDRGYAAGQCSYRYRTVHFKGQVDFLADSEEKRRVLSRMIEEMEPDPEPVSRKWIHGSDLANVAVGRVRVLEMSGKQSPAPKRG